MSLAFYLNTMVGGLLTGLVYGLAALGLSVIFAALRVVNFAHGGMMAAGLFGVALLTGRTGLDPLLTLPVVAVVLFGAGLVLERFLLRRLATAPEPLPSLLMVGVALMLAGGLAMLSGLTAHLPHPLAPGLQGAPGPGDTPGPGRWPVRAAWVAVVVTTLLFMFFNVGRTGKAIRACADNPFGARVIGLNLARLRMITFGIGAAVTGLAGGLLAETTMFRPELVANFTLTGFVIVLAGGLGSPAGALLAGILVGIVEALAAVIPTSAPALPPGLAGAALMLVVLVLRPLGLLGRSE